MTDSETIELLVESILSDTRDVIHIDLSEIVDILNRQQTEIERVKAEAECAEGYAEALEQKAKAEAVKEFAERLHCHCQGIINEEWNKKVYPNSWADAYEEFDEVVDDLVREMVGEG